ncbi:hypothetical protein EWM64_g2280 [Hericium alpestre]|uniref:Nudix hydrolase domain-containing protein n=1 Tax=Hericium alpestre TaxID=135208 RepID=A0A4Z0A743_9AGAM|nr:hypothetical protein EWM64_g2280 [Hericium alpestre]
MADPKIPTDQFRSEEFLICGGSILFQDLPPPSSSFDASKSLHICLLRHTIRNEWLLPKGRKDRDENVSVTAVRETYEETGYPCKLLPITLDTRAPEAFAQTKDRVESVEESREPFMMTLRRVTERNVKLIWWFVSIKTGELQPGTQTVVESYESEFVAVEDALKMATFQSDRDVIQRAVDIVCKTYYNKHPDVQQLA